MQLSELSALLKLGSLSHAEGLAQIAANTEQSYLNFLLDVLKAELAERTRRSREVLLRTAGLPVIKTLEQYDFGFSPGPKKMRLSRDTHLSQSQSNRHLNSCSWRLFHQ